MATASQVFDGLVRRGFSPLHAAVLAGNIQQESNFNTGAVNPQEGANGLLQWRLDRWTGLQDFAKNRGKTPSDLDTQLDFIVNEMQGSEAKNAAGFLSAADPGTANAALKNYIRYGDQSGPNRLKFAEAFLGAPQPNVQQQAQQVQQQPQQNNRTQTKPEIPFNFAGQAPALPAFDWSPSKQDMPMSVPIPAMTGVPRPPPDIRPVLALLSQAPASPGFRFFKG